MNKTHKFSIIFYLFLIDTFPYFIRTMLNIFQGAIFAETLISHL